MPLPPNQTLSLIVSTRLEMIKILVIFLGQGKHVINIYCIVKKTLAVNTLANLTNGVQFTGKSYFHQLFQEFSWSKKF